MGNITGKTGRLMLLGGSGLKDAIKVRIDSVCPEIAGTRWPSVAGHTEVLNAAETRQLTDCPGYLSGAQTIKNSSANVLTVEIWDNDPAVGGSRYLGSIVAAANAVATLNYGGALVVFMESLWIKITGTTPNGTLGLLVNY